MEAFFFLGLVALLIRRHEYRGATKQLCPNVAQVAVWLFWLPAALGALGLVMGTASLADALRMQAAWGAVQVAMALYLAGARRVENDARATRICAEADEYDRLVQQCTEPRGGEPAGRPPRDPHHSSPAR